MSYKRFASGNLNDFWKRASAAEVFKFTFYLSIPLASSVFYADPDFMHNLIRKLKYVEYPKMEQHKVPSTEERENIRRVMEEIRKQEKLNKERWAKERKEGLIFSTNHNLSSCQAIWETPK